MTEKKIRIGVMGCASIAKRSMIPAILLSDQFRLVAIASRTKEKAMEFSTLFHCEALIGYDTLLLREDIDAVYMPLPTGLHKEWIGKALKSGKHVLAEKSLAYSFSDAQNMVHLARHNNVALMENYMFQYHPQHQIVQQWLQDGKIGHVRLFRADFGFPPLSKDNFRYDEVTGGGALLDAAGYTVRALQFLLGTDFVVKAATLYHKEGTQTNVYGSAFLTNGAGLDAQVAFGMDHYYQCKYALWGSEGKITAHWAFTPKSDSRPVLELKSSQGNELIEVEPNNHFLGSLQAFADTIIHPNRNAMFTQILTQSKTLDDIRSLSKPLKYSV